MVGKIVSNDIETKNKVAGLISKRGSDIVDAGSQLSI